MKKTNNQPKSMIDFIKVARCRQELLLMEMKVLGISSKQIEAECGMSPKVFKNFIDGIAQPIKLILLKDTIKHILKERDIRNCQNIGKQSVTYPRTEAFLEDIERMELYMPLEYEEAFIRAAGHLDQGNHIESIIADMKDLMKREGIPPIETNVGKREAKRRIDLLTHHAV